MDLRKGERRSGSGKSGMTSGRNPKWSRADHSDRWSALLDRGESTAENSLRSAWCRSSDADRTADATRCASARIFGLRYRVIEPERPQVKRRLGSATGRHDPHPPETTRRRADRSSTRASSTRSAMSLGAPFATANQPRQALPILLPAHPRSTRAGGGHLSARGATTSLEATIPVAQQRARGAELSSRAARRMPDRGRATRTLLVLVEIRRAWRLAPGQRAVSRPRPACRSPRVCWDPRGTALDRVTPISLVEDLRSGGPPRVVRRIRRACSTTFRPRS